MFSFIYSNEDKFPDIYKNNQIDFSETIKGLIYFSKIERFRTIQDRIKYIGMYKSNKLIKIIKIDYVNIINTIEEITSIINRE